MHPRYERNVPALTQEECGILRRKRVLVVGCGGLGGHLIEMLARIGIGAMRVVDGDVWEPTNLNRQLLSEMPLLGDNKAKTAAARVARVNPEVALEAEDAYLTEENVHRLVQDCDAVLDGLDNPQSRKVLANACARMGIPYIYGAVTGWVAQAAISMPGDRLLETLYPEGTAWSDKSVLSFTPALCAAMQVALCTKLLVGRSVETGMVYYFDLLHQEYAAIPFHSPKEGNG